MRKPLQSTDCARQEVPPLRVTLLSDRATIPTRGSAGAAGFDLGATEGCLVPARGKALIKTDVAIAIPEGFYGRIAPRSSLAWKSHLDTGAGVIDSDYRGNVGVVLFNHSEEDFQVEVGMHVAQLIITKIETPEIEVVTDLDDTSRGAGGYGSTGKYGLGGSDSKLPRRAKDKPNEKGKVLQQMEEVEGLPRAQEKWLRLDTLPWADECWRHLPFEVWWMSGQDAPWRNRLMVSCKAIHAWYDNRFDPNFADMYEQLAGQGEGKDRPCKKQD
jgi:dUTP pyrophosphatase